MIELLETLLAMAVAAVAVLLAGQLGPALGWPVPVSVGVPAAAFLAVGLLAAHRPEPNGRHHG